MQKEFQSKNLLLFNLDGKNNKKTLKEGVQQARKYVIETQD